jgi:hypothetical protein
VVSEQALLLVEDKDGTVQADQVAEQQILVAEVALLLEEHLLVAVVVVV